MKEHITKGDICLKDEHGFIYRLCTLSYITNPDDHFKYVFMPNYSVIDLLPLKIFQGIPGLNLKLRRKEYGRDNFHPVFITERVPQRNREDFLALLEEVGMSYMDPIIYLTKTKNKYHGDNFFVLPHQEKVTIKLDNLLKISLNNHLLIKKLLENLTQGNDIALNDVFIDDSNRKVVHHLLMNLYERSLLTLKEERDKGVLKAKTAGRYKGRKPVKVDPLRFYLLEEKIKAKELTVKEAAEKLGISIDKYYRFRKEAREKNS